MRASCHGRRALQIMRSHGFRPGPRLRARRCLGWSPAPKWPCSGVMLQFGLHGEQLPINWVTEVYRLSRLCGGRARPTLSTSVQGLTTKCASSFSPLLPAPHSLSPAALPSLMKPQLPLRILPPTPLPWLRALLTQLRALLTPQWVPLRTPLAAPWALLRALPALLPTLPWVRPTLPRALPPRPRTPHRLPRRPCNSEPSGSELQVDRKGRGFRAAPLFVCTAACQWRKPVGGKRG